MWGVGPRLVACESNCAVERASGHVPGTWLISAKHAERDASLLPSATDIEKARLRYWGQYPDALFAISEVGADENGAAVAFRYFRGDARYPYVEVATPLGSSLGEFIPGKFAPEFECRAPGEPRTYTAEVKAAWKKLKGPIAVRNDLLLVGHGGPLLVIEDRKMSHWNGDSWVSSAAPWCQVASLSVLRLKNGASFVLSEGGDGCKDPSANLFWISASGEPHPIALVGAAGEGKVGTVRFREPVELDHQVWLVADADAGTVLFAPVAASEVTRPLPEPNPACDPNCPMDLKAEVLAQLWKRPRAREPGLQAPTIQVDFNNEYHRTADALLIAVDGVPRYFKCEAPEGRGQVFRGPLAPGIHYVDAVFNFGPGRVGKRPYPFQVKAGQDLSITVLIGRGDHERPGSDIESKVMDAARAP